MKIPHRVAQAILEIVQTNPISTPTNITLNQNNQNNNLQTNGNNIQLN